MLAIHPGVYPAFTHMKLGAAPTTHKGRSGQRKKCFHLNLAQNYLLFSDDNEDEDDNEDDNKDDNEDGNKDDNEDGNEDEDRSCWYNAIILYLSVLFALQKENGQMDLWLEKRHF